MALALRTGWRRSAPMAIMFSQRRGVPSDFLRRRQRDSSAELVDWLERWIGRRTRRRVHALRVEFAGVRVIVRGRCRSFYVWQLALAAAREALARLQYKSLRVEMEIEVANMQQVPA
jgi:hypothetical protein